MQEFYGHCNGSFIIAHGGAGFLNHSEPNFLNGSKSLRFILQKAYRSMSEGLPALAVVEMCLKGLEENPLFNAGYGATLQADGQARLTAAVMDGPKQRLSGVIGAMQMVHPSSLAVALQERDDRILGPPGIELLARTLKTPVQSPLSEERLVKWSKQRREFSQRDQLDTVGVVVCTAKGKLYAGTSTGGKGYEFPGRISDAATVAGTYASSFAAISATGIGEEITSDALAARVETRCRDGQSLEQACQKALQEAVQNKRCYGWIAASNDGHWAVCHTTPTMVYGVIYGGKILLSSSKKKRS